MNRLNSGWDALAMLIVAGLESITQDSAAAAESTPDGIATRPVARKHEFNPKVITIRLGDHVETDHCR
jgi:hypothetical protein